MGRPWDLDRTFSGGLQLLQPYKGRFDTDWYVGTADAVTQNLNFVRRGHPEYTLILSGDHIYTMDYRDLIDYHRERLLHSRLAGWRQSPRRSVTW
jgi:glucose-1-phosphate adenylyltransferase